MVRGTFSPARAWRPTVGASLAPTLGLTGTLRGAPAFQQPDLDFSSAIPRITGSPDFPLGIVVGDRWLDDSNVLIQQVNAVENTLGSVLAQCPPANRQGQLLTSATRPRPRRLKMRVQWP